MSTARPHGVFQNGFDLVGDGGAVVAVFHGSVWSEKGTVTAGSWTWDFGKQGSGFFRLSGPGGEVASARRTGIFSSTWDVAYDGRVGTLVRRGFWMPRYELCDPAGGVVGEVAQDRAFGRALAVRLPGWLAPHTQAFLTAVVLTLMNRARRSSAATSATT